MIKRLSAVAVAGALVLGAPAAAMAQTATAGTDERVHRTAETVKARAHEAISRRLETLDRLAGRVRDSRTLTDAHRAALAELVESQQQGLTALDAKIQADTDPETLRADVKSIVTDYRVYLLTVPKVHLVICADTEIAVADRLDDVATRLQQRIDAAAAAGKDVATAQGHLDEMKAKVAGARAAASGVPDQVLPLVPQDYPDNKPTLDAARASLATGRAALRDARELARQVVADLKAL
jgi:hypothetical protein